METLFAAQSGSGTWLPVLWSSKQTLRRLQSTIHKVHPKKNPAVILIFYPNIWEIFVPFVSMLLLDKQIVFFFFLKIKDGLYLRGCKFPPNLLLCCGANLSICSLYRRQKKHFSGRKGETAYSFTPECVNNFVAVVTTLSKWASHSSVRRGPFARADTSVRWRPGKS